jgi:hypothetical protein
VITILVRIMSNYEFITLKVKMGNRGFGIEDYFKHEIFILLKLMTHVVLKTCILQDQLVIGELGDKL